MGYKIPEYLKRKQRNKVKMNKRLKDMDKEKFPNCIGRFPDENCKKATAKKPTEDCFNCPFYK